MKIKIFNPKLLEFGIPQQNKSGDAGYDVKSMEGYCLNPGEYYKFKLGFGIEIPSGFVGLIQGRSGLATTNGIDTIGNVIDSGYTGEISATLVNHGTDDLQIIAGSRIAQLVVVPYYSSKLKVVDELSSSERGENGFGSTGIH